MAELTIGDHMVLDADAIQLELQDGTCMFTGKPIKVAKINPELERGKWPGKKYVFYRYPAGTHEVQTIYPNVTAHHTPRYIEHLGWQSGIMAIPTAEYIDELISKGIDPSRSDERMEKVDVSGTALGNIKKDMKFKMKLSNEDMNNGRS